MRCCWCFLYCLLTLGAFFNDAKRLFDGPFCLLLNAKSERKSTRNVDSDIDCVWFQMNFSSPRIKTYVDFCSYFLLCFVNERIMSVLLIIIHFSVRQSLFFAAKNLLKNVWKAFGVKKFIFIKTNCCCQGWRFMNIHAFRVNKTVDSLTPLLCNHQIEIYKRWNW